MYKPGMLLLKFSSGALVQFPGALPAGAGHWKLAKYVMQSSCGRDSFFLPVNEN